MRWALLSAALLFGAAAAAGAQAPAGGPAVDLNGKLYKTVFSSGPSELKPADLAPLPAATRARVEAYLQRRASFRSRLEPGATSFELAALEAKKRAVERAIVSLIDAAGIESAAAEYVKGARMYYEWEGMREGPLGEAAYAEDFLKGHPSTPLAPYLYVFIAHRQRAAFETMNAAKDKDAMVAAAKKYRTFMQRARSAEDRIFALLADDMDRQPFLYTRTEHHPRDFDPDS